MGPAGTLLIVDRVIAPGNVPDSGKFLDLHMLALLGGRERTAAEFRGLLADAGFTLSRILPTQAAESILEAKPL